MPRHPDGTLVYRTGLTDTGEVAEGVSAVLLNGGHHNRDREYEVVTTFEAVLKPVSYTHLDVYKRQLSIWMPDAGTLTELPNVLPNSV